MRNFHKKRGFSSQQHSIHYSFLLRLSTAHILSLFIQASCGMWDMRMIFASIAALALVPGFGIAYFYRPVGDHDEVDKRGGPKRTDTFMSTEELCDRANMPPPLLYRLLSMIVVVGVTSLSRVFIYGCGKFRVREDKNYENFVNRVRERNPGVPLITVCLQPHM